MADRARFLRLYSVVPVPVSLPFQLMFWVSFPFCSGLLFVTQFAGRREDFGYQLVSSLPFRYCSVPLHQVPRWAC